MGKITKIHKSIDESIAEIELQRLYDKALNSSDGLNLEDIKKFDILVKTLREAQKESQKELEARYQELKQALIEELPSEAIIKYLEEQDAAKEESSVSQVLDIKEDPEPEYE